jgi:hypothetical protein
MAMTSTIVSMTLAFAMGATGDHFHHGGGGGWVTPDGPGYGWGFPNGNPDGYGWWDHGYTLPLGANRTPEYFFPRQFSYPVSQMFLPTYYNPYVSRGQRYIPYAGCGGCHPMGGPPLGSSTMPMHPYQDTIGSGPAVQLPTFSGRVEAPPINSGGTGLTP